MDWVYALREEDYPHPLVQSAEKFVSKCADGLIVFSDSKIYATLLYNLHLSKCFNCTETAIWVAGKLVFPPQRMGPLPNQDIPSDIIRDFNEASCILRLSPRGASALLRLCVQKLMVLLGEKGRNIDGDIANLVKKGLSPKIQQALDVLRVVGNEAVHPGEMDLRDDLATATSLFHLVNLIADELISKPKQIEAMYSTLPPAKLAAIERRDRGPSESE